MSGETTGGNRLDEWRHRFVTVTSERERLLGYVTVLPVLVLFTLTAVIPIGWALYASLFEIPIFRPEWEWVGTENYSQLFGSSTLHYSLFISTAYAILTTALELVLGVAIALLINRRFRGISLVRMIVLAPYLLPTVVVGVLFSFMGAQFGVFNDLLLRLGVFTEPTSFFTEMPLALVGVVLASIWKFTLFVVLMTLARLQSIPDSYYESAKVCGANAWQQFWSITFPQLRGIILIVLLLRGVWMFNKFDIIWIMTKGGPGDALNVLTVFAYETAFIDFQLGRASAIATIGFIILCCVGVVYFRRFRPSEEVMTR